MARLLRVQFPGAIYHIVTRGDGSRQIFHDDGYYDRLTMGLKEEVTRSGWTVLSYCCMPNHIHLLVQTPEPNLANPREAIFTAEALDVRHRCVVQQAIQQNKGSRSLRSGSGVPLYTHSSDSTAIAIDQKLRMQAKRTTVVTR